MANRRPGLVSPLFTDADQDGIARNRLQYKGGNSPDTTSSPNGRASGGQMTDVHRFNVEEFISILRKLRPYSENRIGDLPSVVKQDLENLSETISVFSSTPYYTDLIKTINKVFSDVKVIRQDTVGAFFQGCFVSNEFPGLQSCSAICAGMVPPTNGSAGFPACTENVYFFNGEDLVAQSIAEPKTDKAIIHVTNLNNYTGFTPINVRQLQDAGIKTVTLYLVDENVKYTEKLNNQPVTNLPLKEPKGGVRNNGNINTNVRQSPQQQIQQHVSQTSNGGNNGNGGNNDNGSGWGWILLILAIIVIVVLLIWAANRKPSNGSRPMGSMTSWSYGW